MTKPLDLDKYAHQADVWSEDRYGSLLRQRNWLLGIAVGLLCCVVAEATALAVLAPLKTSEPYLLKVDKSTGVVETLTALRYAPGTVESLTEDDAVVASYLVPYIIARETYDKADQDARKETVELFSTPAVAEEWRSLYRGEDETNRYVKYRDDQVSVVVTRVAFLNRRTAQVAFTTTWRKRSGSSIDGKYVATVPFEFLRAPSKLQTRWKNPLGFRATNYRVDQEVMTHE